MQELTYTVDAIANGSRGLLEEVATGKVTGEEEYWSRTDLWDFQANVDGARVAFEGVQPIVEEKDAELADQLTTRFDELQVLLDAQREGDGFVSYDELTPDEVKDALRRGQRALRAALAPHRGGAVLSRAARPDGSAGAACWAGESRSPAWRAPSPRDVRRRTPDGPGDAAAAGRPATYAFRGEHQAGIVTPAQDRLHFAAFDVLTDSRDELVDLLQRWTLAAEQMTRRRAGGHRRRRRRRTPARPTTRARRSTCRRAA